MTAIEREIDRCLTLLRNKIRECGFTQLEVQGELGWGRSYLSQLLTRQKSLRMDQVLGILGVIGVDPTSFFGDLYSTQPAKPQEIPRPDPRAGTETHELRQEVGELRTFLRGVVFALVEEKVLSEEDLSRALQVTRRDSAQRDGSDLDRG